MLSRRDGDPMTFDLAAFSMSLENLQAILARAKAAGDTRAVEGITADLVLLVMDGQMRLADAFATAMVDHERRLIAIEAELHGTVE
jgi:hypothetical protein